MLELEDPKSHCASFSGENDDDDDEIQAKPSEGVTVREETLLCGLALKSHNSFPLIPIKFNYKHNTSRASH